MKTCMICDQMYDAYTNRLDNVCNVCLDNMRSGGETEKMDEITKTCEHPGCNESFVPKSNRQKFCDTHSNSKPKSKNSSAKNYISQLISSLDNDTITGITIRFNDESHLSINI